MHHRLRGLILREQISAEADKLITVYTREWGKISAVVPGAKKIKAKLSAATQPIMESELSVYAGSPTARPRVTGVVLLSSFGALRCDWRRFTMAQCCAEIHEVLTPYHLEHAQKYDLLLRTWQLLERAQNPWRITVAFTLRFLRLSGYSFLEYLKRERSGISPAEQHVIKQFATLPGEEVDRNLQFESSLEKEIAKHVDEYLDLYLPRPLATKKFLKKMDISLAGR